MGKTTLLMLSAGLHLYLGLRLLPALMDWPWMAMLLLLLLLTSAVSMPMALLGRRRVRSSRARIILAWTGMLSMGWFSSMFVLAMLRDALLLLLWMLATAVTGLHVDGLVAPSAWAVIALASFATAWGAWNARRTAPVVDVDVPIVGLPDALHGFTIAQITDLHVGTTIRAAYVGAVVDRVNRIGADMVAVTGDLVDGSVAELAAQVAPLSRLTSRHGTFFVTGNHEYYSGAAAWIVELRRLNMRVLLNEHVVLNHNGSELVVTGVTDHGAHHFDAAQRSDAHAALAGSPSAAAMRLLLAHQPRAAEQAAAAGFQLQLSGHTHGGQFWPWNLFVRLQQPFTAGLHRLHDLWIYTSRGTGYWGPPKRFGAPSEITRLRLVRT
ncbi:MAG: metallophosphoesterase [Ideonella sp.]